MFIVALSTIAKIENQSKCPSSNDWLKKMWCIYVSEYKLGIKRMRFCTLQITTTNEITQTWKLDCGVISLHIDSTGVGLIEGEGGMVAVRGWGEHWVGRDWREAHEWVPGYSQEEDCLVCNDLGSDNLLYNSQHWEEAVFTTKK